MEEWDRLQNGLIYNDFDQDLFNRRVKAKKIFRKYNKSKDNQIKKRNKLMNELFKKVGSNVWIEPEFRCEYGKNISIGDNVYINFGCIILDCAEIVIEENTLFGPNIGLYAANHSIDSNERINGGCVGKQIHIGKNCWLGGDVKVIGGVTIGDNSIIGAGSIVTKDIPSNVIAAGNPCKIIREITEKDKTEFSKRIKKR